MIISDIDPESLCLELLYADSENEVVKILHRVGLWESGTYWRPLGDEEFNYSSVGNQQSRSEQAIVEKLINSIDAQLMAGARLAGDLPTDGSEPQSPSTPKSIAEAREKYFGESQTDLERLSRRITVSATGAKPRQGNGRPCYTIVDDGEGQSPQRVHLTLLSLHSGNKDKIKFAQGKFNMGGTGVLEFCGMEHNLQLIITRRDPRLIPEEHSYSNHDAWSFTVVRRQDPTGGKSSRFVYLAPIDAELHSYRGHILTFRAESLPLFPEKNKPYARSTAWGTLIKLYEYDARRFSTNMMFEDGLMYRARLLLPEPALPIRFHECRAYRGDPSRSFDTTMVGLIDTLNRDYDDPKRDSVEWYDRVPFVAKDEEFTARIYLFKNKAAADTYRRDEGIIYSYNGQCHAVMSKDFFRRKKVKQDYLWHSLLVIIDCSKISVRAHERLFMASRDRLRDGDLRSALEDRLEDLLRNHDELRELASERQRREQSKDPQTVESMARVLEKLVSRNPSLASILGQGTRISNPHKPVSGGGDPGKFVGQRFPTKFHFKGKEPDQPLDREAHLESQVRVGFETDAADDYFRREHEHGKFDLYRRVGGALERATDYQSPHLHKGVGTLSLLLPNDAKTGDSIEYEAHVSDPSQVEPFVCKFVLRVKSPRTVDSGGPGQRDERADDPDGDGKGRPGSGRKPTDSTLDIPEPTWVHQAQWSEQEPHFDRFTAMRILRPPDAPDNSHRYDYYVNIDNVYLQQIIKQRPKDADTLKLRFAVGMTLVALSLVHQERLREQGQKSNDMPSEEIDIRDRVTQTTCAVAPLLIPLIESVSELEATPDAYSSTAGEIA